MGMFSSIGDRSVQSVKECIAIVLEVALLFTPLCIIGEHGGAYIIAIVRAMLSF